ncbi:MAG TPA: hypothetical protein VI636_21730 [Candidatus Angelobacter sp.]
MFPKYLWNWLLFLVAAAITAGTTEQRPAPSEATLPSDPSQFVREMVQRELDAQNHDHSLWRYRIHKEDEANSQDRDVIQTKEGSLAKTLLINGNPLTQEQRKKDQERMKNLVENPSEQDRREHRSKQDEDKARELLRAIPDAFLFKYDGTEGNLTRLTFSPNPRYSPPTRELMVYHAMKGNLTIDRTSLRLVMIEGRLTEDVKFGWGLLGHLDKGGTFKVIQQKVSANHWDQVFMDVNMTGRAVIFKTLNVKTKQILSDFRRVPDDTTMARAYEMLQEDSSSVTASRAPAK